MKAAGEAALDLPWLCPCAASLAALARSASAAVWTEIRHDPGAVLLLTRVQSAHFAASQPFATVFAGPTALETSLNHLLQFPSQGFLDWNQPEARPLLIQGLRQAWLAERLAQKIGCPPDQAWIGGLLAPLGWYALATVTPQNAPTLAGLDHTSLVRRLGRAWRLPAWLSAIIGHLSLPAGIAAKLGADPKLFQIVQLAVASIGELSSAALIGCPADPRELAIELGLAREDVEQWARESETVAPTLLPPRWQNPGDVPLLTDFLRLSLDQRRASDPVWIERLQQEVDLLQQALDQQRADEKSRLERLKLVALGELAAGAGHEINNPLAVISGQAQYVLKHLQNLEHEWQDDPAAAAWLAQWKAKVGKSLQTIVGQSQRIHHVLTDLMQFARPSPPKNQEMLAATLLQEAIGPLAGLAMDKQVKVEVMATDRAWLTRGDAGQWRTALQGLVRNAIEAAPPEGWVGLRIEPVGADDLHVIVEDNGPGPPADTVEHLFDPFYSGRAAGRGRGLGLPTAWRLARQNGGDVRFAGVADGRTRFILSLPARETTPHVGYFTNDANHVANGQIHNGLAPVQA